ncbi:DUF1295 domain containing protein [Nitzschia inconspicua]|uniref:DUF1295 domain containing protein n=1 Tax=Nitzschia inconspicua TaxID=303405 RepID=A0A9K3L212_9STRA|nr:DUF1295 domain containing protein [Nitzschia inconspicua]
MESITQTISNVVTSNSPYGPLGLWTVASLVVIPLTLYRQGYAFSVGYGFSVAAMALFMMQQFQATLDPLVLSAVFYGVRLATYLLLRQFSSPEKNQQVKNFDKSPRLKRIPFAASVSLFYTFMMTPIMYVLRTETPVTNNVILNTGAFLAWCGAILEAIADYHKFLVKQRNRNSDGKTFVGPTSGVYRITRHPNYTGEVLFWFGVFVSGMPFFNVGSTANQIVGWVCSGLGFYGIYSIMTGATKRLDEKQKENYKGQKAYDKWRSKVKPPLFPFIHVE